MTATDGPGRRRSSQGGTRASGVIIGLAVVALVVSAANGHELDLVPADGLAMAVVVIVGAAVAFSLIAGEPLGGRWHERLIVYAFGSLVFITAGSSAGLAIFEATACRGGGECDLGGLAAIVWGFVAFIVSVFLVIINECRLASRRILRSDGPS